MSRKIKKREKIPEWAASLYWGIAILNYKLYIDMAKELCHTFIPSRKNLKILDVGTGHGFLPIEIVKLRPETKIYGFDLNKKLIRYANQQGKEELYFFIADANALPFSGNCFDLVISTGVLHELRDPVGALNECYRVLKSYGMTIIYDPVPLRSKVKISELSLFNSIKYLIYKLHKKIYPRPPKHLSFEQAKDIIVKTKFERWQIKRDENQDYLKIVLKKEK
ncbi:MAG: class I SAM-dependent methyltransferase [Nitrospirota bacterium]